MSEVVPPPADERVPYTLRELVLYFLRLGTLGFGGPIAHAGYMQRDLVERRRWLRPEDYKQGLALAQLAPGPLAAQLAIYLGWVKARIRGATLVAIAFIVPSFVMVIALATKTHTISDSVNAVTTPLTTNTSQSSGSFASVSFVSFTTLRAMTAMTAAPTP